MTQIPTPISEDELALNFPDSFSSQFPSEFDFAFHCTTRVLERLPTAHLKPLAKHSPGLENYDWSGYIRLSLIRLLYTSSAIRKSGAQGRALDFGSYFGNFSLLAKTLGFSVDAADNYSAYGNAFAPFVSLLEESGISVVDIGEDRRGFSRLEQQSYDLITCMGVIEHIPHSPKDLLCRLDSLLKPGGLMILDTPNLGYLYTREKLQQGKSIFLPIQLQFHVDPPFEGHHREYTPDEVEWMLREIGHEQIELQMFNYSLYGLPRLTGQDLSRFRFMQEHPSYREIIMSSSKKALAR
jgi:2-polyprenyl-3-methyl-5-hydroxy-6-metoxy-1,4-benzoquinol methylase